MHTAWRSTLVLCLLACAGLPLAAADKAPAAPTAPTQWRQFKEFPDVLLFEGFEHDKSIFLHGTILDKADTPDPASLGPRVYKFPDKQPVKITIELFNTPLKLPGALDTAQINVQFSIWVDTSSEVTFVAVDYFGNKLKNYDHKEPYSTPKTWTTFHMRLSDCFNHLPPEHTLSFLDFEVTPREKGKTPVALLDNFIITYQTDPVAIVRRVEQVDIDRIGLSKSFAQNGYVFSAEMRDALQKRLGARRKRKSVLVAGTQPRDTQALIEALNAAQAAQKDGDFTFAPATDPAGAPVGGLGNATLFLPQALLKTPSDIVLLRFDSLDATSPGKPGETVGVVAERALAFGALPVICGQPASATGLGAQASATSPAVPWIDPSFAAKAPADQGLAPLAALTLDALKQIRDALAKD